ncbi:MAG TPA: hypothetical protein VNY04_04980 [Chthoniobacterales bacterium]|nr:hypothetical protein [Chthoniobacterales bacterium]
MAINLARLRQQDDQERERRREEQAREAARIAAEAAANTPEALFAQRTAEINEAIAKQQAIERANFDAQARAKAARDAELMLIGDQLAERLAPVITAAIAAGFAQLKDDQHTEKET